MSGLLPATQVSPPFLLRDGESFNGGVARFASDNWHERMIEVTSVAGLEFGHRPSASAVEPERLISLANFMGVEAAELSSRSRPYLVEKAGGGGHRLFNGLALPTFLIESGIRRYAPAALQRPDGAYHRALWDLRLLPVCTETGQMLLDRCQNPICEGGRVGWIITSGIAHCEHCMADLRRSQSTTVAPELLAALQPVADLFKEDRRSAALERLPGRLSIDDGQLAADLLVALVPVVDPGLSRDIQRLHLMDPERVCMATTQAWRLMEGWPQRFIDLICRRMEARSKRHGDGNGGRTTYFLRVPNASGSAALSALIADVRSSLDLAGPSGAVIEARTIGIKEAARLLGLGTQQLAELRRGKGFATIPALRAERCELLFDRAEVDRIRQEVSGRKGFDSVSSDLGISHDGVSQLAEMGLLDVLEHPSHFMRYNVHQTTQASFARLTADVLANRSSIPKDECIRVAQAMKAVGGRFKPWGPALQAFLNGDIAYAVDDVRGQFVDRIRIRVKDARRVASLVYSAPKPQRLAPATMMSKADAMEVLNIASKQVTELFADVPTMKGGRKKTLAVVDVLAMARRSISSAELAARRGVATQIAYADAVRSGIERHGLAGFCRVAAEAEFGL